jgi:hypothetical protein
MAYIAKASNAGGFKSLNRYYDMLAGNATFVENSYESIATVTVGAGGASAATFSSIPSTYQHLQIRWSGRSSGTNINAILNVNGDTTSSANWHLLYGTGSAAATYTISTQYISLGGTTVSTDAANIFATGVTDILDYANTNKNKTVRSTNGLDTNGGGYIYGLVSGQWVNTAAITSLTIAPGAGNWAQYSSFALYGIRG